MKKSLKGLLSLAAVGVLSLSSITAYAGEWKQDGRGWWWQEDDGSYVVNQWKWLDGNADGVYEKYHFNAEGYLDVNTVLTDTDGTQVQVNAEGAKLKSNNEVAAIRNECVINNDTSDGFDYDKYMYKSVKDNFEYRSKYMSEYMSDYNELKPGAVFVYNFLPERDVYLLTYHHIKDVEQFAYYQMVSETEIANITNFYADKEGQIPTGKIWHFLFGDANGGNGLCVFIYE